jgi:hypothetical protein
LPFLTLNGWTVPVLDKTPSAGIAYHGELGPRFSNRPSRVRTAIPRNWTFTAKFGRIDWADTLICLLEGRGHHFPFDRDAWSRPHSLGPDADPAAALPPTNYEIVNTLTATPKFGYSFLRVKDGFTVIWDAELPDKWTVMVWRREAGVWHHYAVRNDGSVWKNGSLIGTPAVPWLVVSNGTVALVASGADEDFDDLVILPTTAAYEFIEANAAWAAAGNPFSDLPYINLQGDFLEQDSVEALGSHMRSKFVQRGLSIGWQNNEKKIEFTFEEREQPALKKIPKPLWLYAMDEKYQVASPAIVEAAGSFPDATRFGGTFVAGPFGHRRSLHLNNTSEYLTLEEEPSVALGGLGAITVLAWVRRDVLGTFDEILALTQTGTGFTQSKFRLNVSDTNFVRVSAFVSGSMVTFTSTQAITDNEWHQVGGIVNRRTGYVKVVFDGAVTWTSSLQTFSPKMFSSAVAAGVGGQIGHHPSPGNYWPGDVATVGLWPSEVPSGALRSHFELGHEGVLV